MSHVASLDGSALSQLLRIACYKQTHKERGGHIGLATIQGGNTKPKGLGSYGSYFSSLHVGLNHFESILRGKGFQLASCTIHASNFAWLPGLLDCIYHTKATSRQGMPSCSANAHGVVVLSATISDVAASS